MLLIFSISTVSVCNGTGDYWSCCTAGNPCALDEGDCDSDAECLGNLSCGTDNCLSPFASNADCCIEQSTSSKFTSKKKFPFKKYCFGCQLIIFGNV